MPRVPDMSCRFGHPGTTFRPPVRLPPATSQAFQHCHLSRGQSLCLSTWVPNHPLPASTPAASAHTQIWPRQPQLYFTPVVASTPLPPTGEPGTFPPQPLGVSVPNASAHIQVWPRQPQLYFTPVVASTPLPPAGTPGTFPPQPLGVSVPHASPHTQLWPPQPQLYFTPVVASTPLPPAWEPGTFPPEPLGISVPLHLHPHLTPNPLDPSIPTLLWDVIHPPELARIYSGRHLLLPVDLEAKAVRPMASELYIASDHPVLASWMSIWGPIMVRNSDITLRDVLDAIYTYLQEPMKPQEMERLKSVPGNEANIQYAAHQRATDSYDLYSVTMKSGFRRVDVLGGHRMFMGLRPVVFQDNTWKLYLSLRPGPVPRCH